MTYLLLVGGSLRDKEREKEKEKKNKTKQSVEDGCFVGLSMVM
jgi:hypothetical protein